MSRSHSRSRSQSKTNPKKINRSGLLDKKFKLLFDKDFKEDKKKVEAIKEEIKKEELKYQLKEKRGKESLGKIGKKFDISEETSDNDVFSEDEPDEHHSKFFLQRN